MKRGIIAALVLALLLIWGSTAAGDAAPAAQTPTHTAATLSASKTARYYSRSGELQFTLTLNAEFCIDAAGSPRLCGQSFSYNIYNPNCSLLRAAPGNCRASDIAAADITAVFAREELGMVVDTKAISVQLTCDNLGRIE